MNQIIKGSIGSIAQTTGKSIAETFLSADVVIIVDTSGSMGVHDARGDRQRYEVALEELARLQNNLPGKIAVIAFSSTVEFVPSGQPPFLGGGTNLAQALKFAKIADVEGMRFIVISDGMPDDENAALAVAANYINKIDVIYTGPSDDTMGRRFLEKLAQLHKGSMVQADRCSELAATTEKLLLQG